MTPETREELQALMRETVRWLTGDRGPLPLGITLLIDPRDFESERVLREIPAEDLISRARTLRGEALRITRELSNMVVTTSSGGNAEIARFLNNLTSFSSALSDSLRKASKVQTVTLDQDPTRFRFRKGERVALKRDDGSTDLENSGVVVDGVWEGQVGGGSYRAVYYVERPDGLRFAAPTIQLIRLPTDG